MRKIKFLAMAAFLAVATSASAQFTNSTSGSSTSSAVGKNADGWSTFWVEWNPMTLVYDYSNAPDDLSFTAFSAGFSKAFAVSAPLFVEVGVGVQYSFCTDDEKNNVDIKYSLLSAKVPVNLMYAFQLPNSSISLIPFAGIGLRYNFSGEQKYEYESQYQDDEKNDLFDKKDMGSSDATWKRLQFGYQVGLKARINDNLLLGISYGSDFSEIVKKTSFSTTSLTLGYVF